MWESIESLKDYVYRGLHVEVFRRRAEWLEPEARRVALWWIPAGELPTLAEGIRRLEHLEAHGPSAHAFGFASAQAPGITRLPDPPG